jgi:hypothetical protein
MTDMTKLPAEPIQCPICDIGQAFVYEELQPASPVSAQHVLVELRLHLRICNHCEAELAGAEETRFNKEQVLAAREQYGALKFLRKSEDN